MSEHASNDKPRTILHADMDAFYAAIEVLDDPSLAGKPLIVGHPGPRGVVSTASYEARKFGVGSAMPSAIAKRRCPQGVWRPGRMERYAEVAAQVRDVFRKYSPVIEPLSLDEAFIDVTGSLRLHGGARALGESLRATMLRDVGLRVSVGIADSKLVAKIASDLEKPDALVIVEPGTSAEFLAPLPIERLWGVGPKSAEKLRAAGFNTFDDLANGNPRKLERTVGPDAAERLPRLARGEDGRPVVTHRERKQVSAEHTYGTDLRDPEEIDRALFALSDDVASRLRKKNLLARTIGIKVRAGDFETWTRTVTPEEPTDEPNEIADHARALFRDRVPLRGRGVRLLGVSTKNFLSRDEPVQGDLFSSPGSQTRTDFDDSRSRVAEVQDRIAERFGKGSIERAKRLRPK